VREGGKVRTFPHRKGDVIDPNDAAYEERSCVVEGKKVTPCEFAEGSGVELSVTEWLKMAGLGDDGLDEINEAGMKGRPPFSEANLPYVKRGRYYYPSTTPLPLLLLLTLLLPTHLASLSLRYRTSGVAIDLDMKWMGGWSKGEVVELHIFVDAQGGWHSKGSEVHYDTYPVSNDDGVFSSGTCVTVAACAAATTAAAATATAAHSPRLPGTTTGTSAASISSSDTAALSTRLTVRWLPRGGRPRRRPLTRPSPGAIFVVKMTSLTVLLSLSETIVVAVAVSLLGYKSKVYTKTLEQPVSINSLHAKIASQALIATAAYQSINTNVR